MNRRYLSILTSVLYLISFTAVILMLSHALDIITFAHGEKIFMGVVVVVCGYAAASLRAFECGNGERRKKILRKQLLFTFIFYIIMLLDFTLIDDTLGRNIFNVFSWNKTAFLNYINTSTNLVPFETVILFINGYKNGHLSLAAMLENILGNFVVFMPLPFFINCLFKNFEKTFSVFSAVIMSVVSVELLQFLFLTGSCDIDDVILNVTGAMLFYLLIKTKTLSRGIEKFTFGVWETVEK